MNTCVIVFRSSSLDSKIAACVAEYDALRDDYDKVEMMDADTVSNNYLYNYLLNCVRQDGVTVCVIGEGLELVEEIKTYATYDNLVWFDNTVDDSEIDFAVAGIRDRHLYNYMLAETYFFGDNGVLPYRIMKTLGRMTPIKAVRDTVTEFINGWKKQFCCFFQPSEEDSKREC